MTRDELVIVAHFVLLFTTLIYSSASVTNKNKAAGFCKEKGCSEPRKPTAQPNLHPEQQNVRPSGMEWRSHGRDNDDLVSQLKRNEILKTQKVEEAMRKVDRGNYCDYSPYMDSPQSIGYGVTISAPHMHAHALEMLKEHLFQGAKALDVGSGTGNKLADEVFWLFFVRALFVFIL